ncbi:hypothetical protein G7K_5350-t1 [Saitoella complicata NRRL Y-17804]|uniref:Secreted protein n=1 Tax=Saitoella complicata (strain BCRC 22490 / CBS 7301 / JCM 7358 / NBRC 10748 / NRRL Y-17804) TaxID=698492 RepID=A0A0E9NMY8_SAICN|nr:hypothetical protein G7K_5350-t1 [Saitoella complicata NRRL Y-17804]
MPPAPTNWAFHSPSPALPALVLSLLQINAQGGAFQTHRAYRAHSLHNKVYAKRSRSRNTRTPPKHLDKPTTTAKLLSVSAYLVYENVRSAFSPLL